MTARLNPWWIVTALLTGLVVALSVFAVSRTALAATGSAPASVPGGGSPPGHGSPPGEYSPPYPEYFQIGLEIESAHLDRRSGLVDVTVTVYCPDGGAPGQSSAPLGRTEATLYVAVSQARGRGNIGRSFEGVVNVECRNRPRGQRITVTATPYEGSGTGRLREGPVTVTADISANGPVLYFYGFDNEAVDLQR